MLTHAPLPKVRRSNPALSHRLGEQGFRLLQSCGYTLKPHASRNNEAVYLLDDALPARSLEALESLLLHAADTGQERLRHDYMQWLEGGQHPVLKHSWDGIRRLSGVGMC